MKVSEIQQVAFHKTETYSYNPKNPQNLLRGPPHHCSKTGKGTVLSAC